MKASAVLLVVSHLIMLCWLSVIFGRDTADVLSDLDHAAHLRQVQVIAAATELLQDESLAFANVGRLNNLEQSAVDEDVLWMNSVNIARHVLEHRFPQQHEGVERLLADTRAAQRQQLAGQSSKDHIGCSTLAILPVGHPFTARKRHTRVDENSSTGLTKSKSSFQPSFADYHSGAIRHSKDKILDRNGVVVQVCVQLHCGFLLNGFCTVKSFRRML
jgi:hypothetical protein